MDHEPMRQILRSLRGLAESEDGVPEPDAKLLERFVARRDAAAFELLLWRHGPMVLGVCRRLLPNPQDADDAFQATFLTLVKKAGSVARGAALGSWLYQVAYRVALRARITLARRAKNERRGVDELPAPADGEPADPELRRVLDEEVNRLPRRHREAFILCCLEGKTGAEAARLLGCPPGTVSSRLTRARERLRLRLLRRGVAPAVGAAAAILHGDAGAATTPVPLIHSTLQAALAFAAGEAVGTALSPEAVTLAKGALRTMYLSQLKMVAVWLLAACVFAGGAVWTLQALEARPAAQEKAEPIPERAAQPPKDLQVVQVTKPLSGGLERSIQRPGRVAAIDEAELIPRASGVLKNLTVQIGEAVRKGQMVAEIDAPELVLEERQAGATVRQVEGAIHEGDARVAIAKAEVLSAQKVVLTKVAEMDSAKAVQTISRREKERLEKARGVGGARSISESDYAIAVAQEEVSKSKVLIAQAAVEGARADVEVKKGQVMLAEAAMRALTAKLEGAKLTQEKARLALEQTRLVAPLNGVVTRCDARAGDYVRSGATGTPTSLLTIQRADRLRVVVGVPEFYALLTGPGTPVELSFDALPGVRVKGVVARTAFAVDESKGEMRVEIALPNPAGQFRPGMSGKATLHPRKVPNAVRIPESALIDLSPAYVGPGPREGGPIPLAVYVVRGGKAVRTPVERGIQGKGGEVEILFGLGPEDLVVTDPSGLSGETVAVEVKGKR